MCGGLVADSDALEEGGHEFVVEGMDETVEVGDLVVHLQVSTGEVLERDLGGCGRIAEVGQVGPPGGEGAI